MDSFSTRVNFKEGANEVKILKSFKYIKGFSLINFQSLNEYNFESNDSEVGLLILEGTCSINVDGKEHKDLGKRRDVFSGAPAAVYIPTGSKFSIKAKKATVALCLASSSVKTKASIIYPEDVKPIKVGKDNWSREVRIIIGPDFGSVNLILGETFNPAGNWSGVPPAKHEDNNLPKESSHEELYYFKTDKPQGWGIERIYSPKRNINELVYLEDNTVTFMPWGYHQVVSAPGYTLYYLFFLAGESNKLVQFEDPDHSWIKNHSGV